MENHFAWWYLSNRPLDVYRLTEDLIATSLHYSPKRRERFLHRGQECGKGNQPAFQGI